MGDLPLRTPTDRWLGGPLHRQQPNQTHPHPSPINLYSKSDVFFGDHKVLGRISTGYPLARGRLDTRYSPVRRSTTRKASFSLVSPRLACVKPVASVHPEPGSNSPLYNIIYQQSQHGIAGVCLSQGRTRYPSEVFSLKDTSRIDRFTFLLPVSQHHIYYIRCILTASCTTSLSLISNLSKNSFLQAPGVCPKASAKVHQISIPSKLFSHYFSKICLIHLVLDAGQDKSDNFSVKGSSTLTAATLTI